MEHSTRGTRGETTLPPPGHEVIRTHGRYFPVRLYLDHPDDPGASAFTRPDGRIVSFAKRTSAILYLYQHQRSQPIHRVSPEGSGASIERSEAVRQSEPQFRALIEHSTDAIALITHDDIIAYASPSMGRITGYEARELEGMHALGLIHPDDLEQVQAALSCIHDQAGTFATVMYRVRHREGTV